MGNIPRDEKVIFKSKFIHFTEYSTKYEFEFFRNLPIFKSGDTTYENKTLTGVINIKANHLILEVEKFILLNDIIIWDEKYLDKENKHYLMKYRIKDLYYLTEYDSENSDYIPSSKIYFDFKINYPIIYIRESTIDPNEKNY